MQQWYTPSELFGLPGLPRSYATLKRLAEEQGWVKRNRHVMGGGIEYHFESLPVFAQNALKAEAEAEVKLPSTGGDRKAAKVEVLSEFKKFCKKLELDHTTTVAREIFAEHYNSGQIWVSRLTRRVIQSFTQTTLFRWLKTVKESLEALAGRWGHRKNWRLVEADEQIRDVCLGMILYSSAAISRTLRQKFPEKTIPSDSTIRAWTAWWRKQNPQEWALISDPAKWKNCYKAANGSAYEQITYANQLWEIDATKGDIFAADGKRWTILQIIDVYSRRILSYVCETSSAANVIEGLLRKAFTLWGLPDRIKLDNGKEFRSTRLEGLCHHLDIELDFCNFRSPQQKSAIERSFGTMTRDLLIRLPGFCGSSVAERQEIRSRNGEVNNEVKGVLTAEEIQKAIEHWITNEYEQRIHLGLGADTPMERWVKSPVAPRRILDERQLDILLAEPVGKNPIVQKKGIRVDKHWYTDELGKWVHWIGKEVQVRHDPMDNAGRVYVFSPDGAEFLFIADAPELTGVSRAARVANAKAEQKTIKKIRKIHKELAERVMEADPALLAAKKAIARDKSKKVVPFERVTEVAAPTAVAEAAQEVQNLLHISAPPQQSPDQLEAQRIRREAIERQIAEKDAQRPPNEIFKELAMQAQAGKQLSEAETEWLDRYRRTSGGAMLYSVYRNHFEQPARQNA